MLRLAGRDMVYDAGPELGQFNIYNCHFSAPRSIHNVIHRLWSKVGV
jgi:hypothetical protein